MNDQPAGDGEQREGGPTPARPSHKGEPLDAERGPDMPTYKGEPLDAERPDMPTYKGEPLDAERPDMPTYKGEPLDAGRGPGLGCFWLQVILLVVLLVLTPLTVVWAAPPWLSATLLIVSLVVLFFVGQTIVFLLRLVAADRATRRRPLSTGARRTVGQLEDETTAELSAGDEAAAEPSDEDDATPR